MNMKADTNKVSFFFTIHALQKSALFSSHPNEKAVKPLLYAF